MYVKYDQKTGNIKGISPKDSSRFSTICVSLSDVEKIVSGKEKRNKYKVDYDFSGNLGIFEKQKTVEYKIGKDFHFVGIDYDHCKSDLFIIQDFEEEFWNIAVSEDLVQKVVSGETKITKDLELSITRPEDPSILYRYFKIDFRNLIKEKVVKVPFEYEFEYDFETNFSIFTPRTFGRYSFYRNYGEKGAFSDSETDPGLKKIEKISDYSELKNNHLLFLCDKKDKNWVIQVDNDFKKENEHYSGYFIISVTDREDSSISYKTFKLEFRDLIKDTRIIIPFDDFSVDTKRPMDVYTSSNLKNIYYMDKENE